MDKKTLQISIIVPCLNEQSFIEQVIRDIINQDIPLRQLEVVFVDGGSTDRTRQIIKKYIKRYKNRMRLLDNSGKFTPHALNLGVQNATGEIIIRMDAHSSYPKHYVSSLINWLQKSNASNVGGSWHICPRNDGIIATSIAYILGHPFSKGYASYRTGFLEYDEEVDSVPYGCFPKEIFEKYGLFNEHLHRNQDIEFNHRIIKGGGKVLLVPDVYCLYYAPGTYYQLWKSNFSNGKWAILTTWITQNKALINIRQYIPLFFVLYCLLTLVLSYFIPFTPFSIFIFLIALIYLSLIGRASLSIALHRARIELLPFLFTAFLVIHFSYGWGSLFAYLTSIFKKNPSSLSNILFFSTLFEIFLVD